MPTQQQIEQEQRDMEFAMQLQREEEQERQAAAAAQQQHVPPPPGTEQPQLPVPPRTDGGISCPNCHAINHVAAGQSNLQHMCGVCNRVLPSTTPSGGATTAPAPQQVPSATSHANCHFCGTINAVGFRNPTGPTQFMCGQCRQMNTIPLQQPVPPAFGGAGGVQQGLLLNKVRCGQCTVVNAVKGGPGTQFRCGTCGSVNEVPGR